MIKRDGGIGGAVAHRQEAEQMAANRALDRAPHKIAGGLLLTAGATILLGIITAEALYTAPYTTRMEISDLGATDRGFILHPSSYIFNATMLVTGAMIILGAYSGRGDTRWQELGVSHRLADSYRDRPRQATVTPRIGGIAVASLDGLVLAA